MYNNEITPFKHLLLICLVIFLGGCAAPGYGPIVEDLSVQARPSERMPSSSTNAPTDTLVTSQAPTLVVTAKPKPYVAPKADVTITAQPISNQVATGSVVQEIILPVVQESPLPPSNQAVVEQLLAEADQLKAQGKVTQAVIQLQRAQRIAPREPKVYARLAALQLSLGEASRAEQLALKGLTLVPNKNSYQYYFWKLIGASRSHLGDTKGEAKAIAEAKKYK
ncbi:hypothetical protein ABXT70_01525 [Candidatus Njordibacter sp. Uisw_039]|jgi:hypothetical protein|uniref:hypothetical protein n=1 Tax=Candidatus Njordibacter sp. Uisw_039 TaxID=3230972 RepID=UPI003A12C07B|tara:strand:+ start:5018 stop:5686 length:669 start_codon:yes stop_codon:yes gene_type:complete